VLPVLVASPAPGALMRAAPRTTCLELGAPEVLEKAESWTRS
jgi:hypothetical protein